MTDPAPLRTRLSQALALVRGRVALPADDTRAITPILTPGAGNGSFPMAGMQMVRTANPQEYKPDGATIRTQGFGKHPVVHACIRVVADLVASVPLVVLTDKGAQESRVPASHPLQRLLDYPGPRMTARSLRARIAVDFLGYGNAMVQLERRAPGRLPTGMRVINPESLQSVWVDAEGDPRRYDYGNWAGTIVMVPAEDVVHVKDLEMSRPFQPDVFGFPRGATAIASLTADNEATQYVRQVVTNDGTPTFAVLLSDEASQDDATAMQDRYRARVVDRGKRGTPAFFGAVRDIKPLGFTLRDLEFPDLRRVSREDICAAFGVDPRMIGIASASNDAGLSGTQYVEARARLVQHTVEPMLAAIEDELNHWLAPEFGNVWISFDADVLRDLVENDIATSTRVQQEFRLGLRSWEESRRALKLPPVPEPTDTIALTSGTQLVPAAVAVIDPRTITEPPPAVPAPSPDTEPMPVPPARHEIRAALSDTALSGEQVEQLVELLESIAEQELPAAAVEAVILAAYPQLDKALVATMVAAMATFPPPEDKGEEPEQPETPETPDSPEMAAPGWWERLTDEELRADPRYQYWARSVAELDSREVGWYDTAKATFSSESGKVGALFGVPTRAAKTSDEILREIERRIRENFAPGGDYHMAWQAAYEALIGELYMVGARQVGGVGLSFSMQSPEVLAAIERRAARLAELVGQTTAENILAAIRAAEVAGLSVKETGRLVQATVYNERITDARAQTIARTESAGAMSQGNWDQGTEMGIYQSKEWLAFEDAKTRPSHTRCMAQGRIPFDDRFGNGLQYPLDPAGSAAEVCNCRCVLAYYVTTVDEQPI